MELTYQSHCPQSRTFDIGDSYMRVASLRLLGVTKFKMAARTKIESRPPKRFIDEVEQPKPCAMKKKPKKDNNLYDIEVIGVDKEKKCMKIHFIGYGSEFDE